MNKKNTHPKVLTERTRMQEDFFSYLRNYTFPVTDAATGETKQKHVCRKNTVRTFETVFNQKLHQDVQTLVDNQLDKIWVWSDLHIDHTNIIGYCQRPFANTFHMNKTFFDNALLIPDNHYQWIIGDVHMGVRERTVPLIEALGQISYENFLLWESEGFDKQSQWAPKKRVNTMLWLGNHDVAYSIDWSKVNVEVLSVSDLRIDLKGLNQSKGQMKLLVSHYPYAQLPEDWVHLHGHTHTNWLSDRHLNVSSEFLNYQPHALRGLLELVLTKQLDQLKKNVANPSKHRALNVDI